MSMHYTPIIIPQPVNVLSNEAYAKWVAKEKIEWDETVQVKYIV